MNAAATSRRVPRHRRRTPRVAHRVALLAVATALSGCVTASARPATEGAVSDVPNAFGGPGAVAIASAIDRLATTGSPWPGWDPRSTPLAIFDGRRTLLFHHPTPPAGFAPVAAAPGVTGMRGRAPWLTANSSTTVGGMPTATLLLTPESPRDTAALAALALHELFHVYQRARHPGWSANEAALFTYPVLREPNLAGRLAESLLLARALRAADPDSVACWAGAALSARATRFQALDSATVQYERRSELHEGLAQYVQLRATGTAASIPAGDFLPEQVRQRSYATGAAMGQLLDRLMPRWREALDAEPPDARSGTTALDALLASAVAARAQPLTGCALDDSLRVRFEVQSREAAAALARRRRAARAAFLARPGITLEVVAEGAPLAVTGFDPLNVTRVSPAEVLHERFLKVASAGGATLEVFGHVSLTRAAGAHPIFDGVRVVTLTGLAAPDVTDSGGVVALTADGLTLRAPGGRVHRDGTHITVTVDR